MPLPDVEILIVDADDGSRQLRFGETGEIVVKAPQLMQGYWKRPEERLNQDKRLPGVAEGNRRSDIVASSCA
jgi:acyl-CoA synthetase (AMP-forming)/AMP-acid ligase II